MAHPQVDANLFDLWGKGIHVSFSASSLDGRPRLTYEAYGKSKSFVGEEIRTAETELGRQITVTTEMVPDFKIDTFSFLLPQINMFQGDPDVRIRTVGIHATHLQ